MNLNEFNNYVVDHDCNIPKILDQLNSNKHKILFVTKNKKLLGSISDGDIRRFLVKNNSLNNPTDFMNKTPCFIVRDSTEYNKRKAILKNGISIVPVLDNKNEIIEIIDINSSNHFPIDVVVMAGGRGMRLSPLTDKTPKPLIELNNKPIIDYNYDQLQKLGVKSFFISVNYLKNQIKDHFNSKESSNYVTFVEEDKPLGTFGSLSLINDFKNDNVMVINSDILTNIDFNLFYEKFLESKCDIGLVSVEYTTQIPYAILVEENSKLVDFKEKPSYSYLINTGIYLLKKSSILDIPKNQFFNATDLLKMYTDNINNNIYIHKTKSYWKDIGKTEDLNQARIDILNLF